MHPDDQYILQKGTLTAPLKQHRMVVPHVYVCPSIASPTILIVCRLNIEISYWKRNEKWSRNIWDTYLFSSAGTSLVPYLWRWLYKATVSTALFRQTVLKSTCSVMQSGRLPASIPSKSCTSCSISLQQIDSFSVSIAEQWPHVHLQQANASWNVY